MSKPDWKDAPDWANYLAMDSTFVWCWFVGEPYLGNTLWLPGEEKNGDGDTFDYIDGMSHDYHTPWKETLEKRP